MLMLLLVLHWKLKIRPQFVTSVTFSCSGFEYMDPSVTDRMTL